MFMEYSFDKSFAMKKYVMTDLSMAPAEAADASDVAALLGMAFGFTPTRSAEYLEHVGIDAFFVARVAGRPAACAALLDARHRFGGGWVPAANVAHVAIAPEARGRGLARPLVDALCAAASSRGAAMVTLFASARPVYRKCGFELAGSEMIYEADTLALPAWADLQFREVEAGDPAIRRAYDRKTSQEAGLLDRTDRHWRELLRAPSHALRAYAAAGDLAVAYAIIDASDTDCLTIRDWHAADLDAATGLLALFGRFRSVYPRVRWHGGPHDDLVAAMPDKGWRIAHQEEWLARIADPKVALERRGYVLRDGHLGLCIIAADGTRSDIALELSAGVPHVRERSAGAPGLTLHAHTFATLFTGFRSASRLRRLGLVQGDDDAVRLADLAFGGPAPWLAEHV
ncbi:GNAT family N-acetyltransferase [Lichenihabitans sp. Uapishka_5]|uniref:GNAT family N-acetyltransferase n=1 Tax=Lichenihabitans sp. Uapishka_5 TaxID=3037302 RepID=UPI0029E8241B|nr:GNAT family N-acetyltransferase [Lichenihabitans sp. Uapishka_5]MDX7951343.1 GNAT family N-acetyltransferase [Lichenihabitans sp. Uapishka_5]